jgi:hypothetical protein
VQDKSCLFLRRNAFTHNLQVSSFNPAALFPELLTAGVVGENEYITFPDTEYAQFRNCFIHQRRADSFVAMRLSDGQMVQVSASAVLTA